MTHGAVPLTARVPARCFAPLVLLVAVLFLVGVGPASAQEDPPVTDPPTTEPPVTEPPVTQPPVTEPPVTQPPSTAPPVTPPATTAPTAPPAPTSPATTNQPAANPTPATTARRGTPTTRATAPAGRTPDATDGPAAAEEPAPEAEAEVEAVSTTSADRTPPPLLVAPTTTPDAPAVAMVESAPVASSKVVPLAVIVGIGLAGLVLVLRPSRGPRPAATDAGATPLLLAGPPLRATTLPLERHQAPPPPSAPRAAAVPAVDPIADGSTVPDADPIVLDAEDDPATPPRADPSGRAGTAPDRGAASPVDDGPDVASLVAQARVGRRSGATGRP